ncbi:hypothetical protein FPV67DRAFT_1667007 [Lyophyllum atratum]|nr:hypothetical protein FPV67DRAFT_1667007 [Lyophyllum atratum]
MESEAGDGLPAIRFQVCGRCKVYRYCSIKCQHAHWPKHKKQCGKILSRAAQDAKQYETYYTPQSQATAEYHPVVRVPIDAIDAIHEDWTLTYRSLICFSLVHATGLADGPPSIAALAQPPQIFFVKLSAAPDLTLKTKSRKAFRVDSAELIGLDEFRRASMNKSHRLYTSNNQKFLLGYNRYTSNSHQILEDRTTMVVQSLCFYNGTSETMYSKSWYIEDSRTREYLNLRKPDDWLAFLKSTVAKGKGWHRDDVLY